jgi:hypothetical protein
MDETKSTKRRKKKRERMRWKDEKDTDKIVVRFFGHASRVNEAMSKEKKKGARHQTAAQQRDTDRLTGRADFCR